MQSRKDCQKLSYLLSYVVEELIKNSSVSERWREAARSLGLLIFFFLLADVHTKRVVVFGYIIVSINALEDQLQPFEVLKTIVERNKNGSSIGGAGRSQNRFLSMGIIFINQLEEDSGKMTQFVCCHSCHGVADLIICSWYLAGVNFLLKFVKVWMHY